MELTISYSQLMLMNYDGEPYVDGLMKILKEVMLRQMELLFLKHFLIILVK